MSPAATMQAFHRVYNINDLSADDIIMQKSPPMKYAWVISDLSSNTCTAFSAAYTPPDPRRNLPGPILNK